MSEEKVYSDSNVTVTTARVTISGTTYALRNITSVKMEMSAAKRGCAILLLLLSILFFLLMLGTCVGGVTTGEVDAPVGFSLLLLGGGLLAAAILWLRSRKPSYHVTIASASGEAHYLTSEDREYIEKVVGSINDAIVRYR